jgi:hypothetical protein
MSIKVPIAHPRVVMSISIANDARPASGRHIICAVKELAGNDYVENQSYEDDAVLYSATYHMPFSEQNLPVHVGTIQGGQFHIYLDPQQEYSQIRVYTKLSEFRNWGVDDKEVVTKIREFRNALAEQLKKLATT